MTDAPRKLILCSCEDTMPMDAGTVGRGCRDLKITTARQLCRSELATFKTLAADGDLTVACTQEAALFEETADAATLDASLRFINVREMAGWSSEAKAAAPKMAALVAASAIERTPAPAVTMESEGIALVLGRDAVALEAAARLSDKLNITVVLTPGADVAPPRRARFPVRFGKVKSATGHLGAFEVTLDSFGEPAASSRAKLDVGAVRNGAISKTDLIIDLTGGAPLFTAHDLRDGYLRADPTNAADVERTLFKAADLVGTFDKPRYITFTDSLCAHKRSRITGCTRCLDVCPAGAITSAGNMVAIDPHICGGCGACAAVCPTGAASYEVPSADTVMRQVRAALVAYRTAGPTHVAPVILFHDGDHGEELIFAAARFGDGLPAHVIPFSINEPTQLGLEQFAASFAFGAGGVRVLTRAKPKHDIGSLHRTLETANRLIAGLGFGSNACSTIETDDPDGLIAALREPAQTTPSPKPASFLPMGAKREVLTLSLRELHRAAPTPVEEITLPALAVFGAVHVKSDGCTLCLACVSACPTKALSASEDRPQLKFDESLCVQCGLCQATCPEKVITLEPRLNFAAFEAGPVTLKDEEPFCCTRCAKPFGVKSTVEKVLAKLEGQHWMFTGANASRLDLIKMCDTCRIEVATDEKMDPYAGPARPSPKTSEDYFREREAAMLAKITKGEA
jgi:ferredoxin